MAKISVGCRVDDEVAQELDDLAKSRGLDRAGVIRAAIAREWGQEGEPPVDRGLYSRSIEVSQNLIGRKFTRSRKRQELKLKRLIIFG